LAWLLRLMRPNFFIHGFRLDCHLLHRKLLH
jgi:hypothetical protein